MARGRMISKAISLDEKVNALPDDTARLLFTWLIPHLDCEGRMHGDPTTVKSIVFPRRNISTRKVEKYLKELEKTELILRYSVNGNEYLCMEKFEKHQTGLHKDREAASQIPPIPQELLRTNSGSCPSEVKVKVKVKEEEGSGNNENTRRLYSVLECTKGFPVYSVANACKLDEVMADYNGLNYRLEFKKFQEYWNTRKVKRPWLALRNWLERAEENKHGKTKHSRDLPKTYTPTPDYPDL